MTSLRHIISVALLIGASISGFSQATDPKSAKQKTEEKDVQKLEPKSDASTSGLHRLSRHDAWDRDIDVNIDTEALEATIETAVEQAMASVEVALKNITIEPIEIDLDNMHINIEPIEIDLHNLDIDVDFDKNDFDLDIHDDDARLKNKDKEKDKAFYKNKSKEKDKDDRKKGLVKIK